MSPFELIAIGFAAGVIVTGVYALWSVWRNLKRERDND